MIDREEVLKVDQAVLPADAIFKGYEENVAQDNHRKLMEDLICRTDEKIAIMTAIF